MTVPGRMLDLSTHGPPWLQAIVDVAVLAVLVAVVAVAVRGVVWMLFGDVMRAAGTSAVVVVLLQTGVVSMGGVRGWVQGGWTADGVRVPLVMAGLVVWSGWLVVRRIGATSSSAARRPA